MQASFSFQHSELFLVVFDKLLQLKIYIVMNELEKCHCYEIGCTDHFLSCPGIPFG